MTENGKDTFSRRLGASLLAAISLVSAGAFLRTLLAATNPTQVTIGNTGPSVTVDNLNGGSAITLIENSTSSITVSFTVTDHNGCADVLTSGNVTTTVYRSGTTGGSSCTANTANCYRVSTSTHSCTSSASANATATVNIYYFADATDSSSSYPSQDWVADVAIRDGTGATSSATSTHRELNTVTGIGLGTSTINYGRLPENTDTSSTNQIVTVKNTGNSSATLQLSGNALTSAPNSIATSSQHYATSSFTFSATSSALSSTPTAVTGFTAAAPPLTVWQTGTALPTNIGSSWSVAYNGYLYAIGGNTGGIATSTIFYAPINATGSIGAWSTTTALPGAIRLEKAVTYGNYLYVLGGDDGAATSTVLFAPINATGSIGTWSTTTVFPATVVRHAIVAHNGYLYNIGGTLNGTPSSSVTFAPINATGSIGTWATTTVLPNAIRHHSAVVENGNLYVIGGYDGSSTSTVFSAPINANGTVGSWTKINDLTSPMNDTYAVANEGILYTFGGDTTSGGAATSSVFFTPSTASGTTSAWSTTTPMIEALYLHSGGFYNGFVYLMGGVAETTAVRYAQLATRNTFWGISIPLGAVPGTYSGTNTFTSIFSP